jgi:hypothetical protein
MAVKQLFSGKIDFMAVTFHRELFMVLHWS